MARPPARNRDHIVALFSPPCSIIRRCNTRGRLSLGRRFSNPAPGPNKRHYPKRDAHVRKRYCSVRKWTKTDKLQTETYADRQASLMTKIVRLVRYSICDEQDRRKQPSDSKKMTPFGDPNYNIKTSYVGATYQVARFPARIGWITALKSTKRTLLHQYRTSLVGAPPGSPAIATELPGFLPTACRSQPGLSSASDRGRGYPPDPPVWILYLNCYSKRRATCGHWRTTCASFSARALQSTACRKLSAPQPKLPMWRGVESPSIAISSHD